MKRKCFKLLSIMIVIVLVFHASAQTTYGIADIILNESKKEKQTLTNEEKYNEEDEEEAKILYEDISKRERNIKHFFTDKGTYQAVIYPSAVHYEVEGEWEEIDNSLTVTTNEKGEEITQNTKNSFKVEFSNNIQEDILNRQDTLEKNEILSKQDSLEIENELDEQNNLVGEMQVEQQELKEREDLQEEFIEEENLKEDQLLKEENVQIEKVDRRKNISESKIVSIENDKFSMKWHMEGTNKTELKQIENTETKENSKTKAKIETKELNAEKTELKNISSAITYSNIMDNIDLDYDVSSDYVKETIVLKSADSARDSFVFNIDMGDSTLTLNEDKSIDIFDSEGERVALIEIPYMFDSKMEYSTDIEVILEKDENLESNIYIMEIIPSLEWLQDEEREYPVKIDPTVTTNLDTQFIEDATINSANIYAVTGPHDIALKAGKGRDGIHRSLIKFTLPTLGAGEQVISAGLFLCGWFDDWPYWDPPPPHGQMDVHKVTSPWSWNTACWANSSEIYDSSRISDFNLFEEFSVNWFGDTIYNIWDITDIAKDWYTNGNYGLMIKEHDESGSVGHESAFYVSSKVDGGLTNGRPNALIEYRNQGGLENYLSYHEQDLGRAGIGYVNDYNGNLTVTHPDAATPGSRMPASINHVYNTNDIDKDWGFGTGWKLNITQMINIEIMKVFGEYVEYAKYLDEDGTIHYFVKDGNSNIYYDEDGLGLTLTKNADLSFTMEDKAGNIMIFERQILSGGEWWHLKEIKDVNGNKITISFIPIQNAVLFYPNKVTDGTGTEITINWINGRISSIVDQAGRTTTYTYDGDYKLVKITYPDLKEINYTYDSRGLLLSAKNIDNSHIDYTYYQTVPYRVNTVKEYSVNNEIGNTLNIEYGNNNASFTDNRGYKTIHTFNNYGNLINISDYGNNVNDINNAYGKSYEYGIEGSGAANKLTFESTVMATDENVISVNNLVKNSGFENGLTNWNRNTDCNTSIDTVVNTSKGNALELNGELWKYKEVTQTVNVSGGTGDVYSFSAWVKNTGVLNLGGRINSLEAIGGESSIRLLPNVVDNNGDWQYVSGVFVTKSNYNSIDISIKSHSQANKMWVKNISLIKDEGGQSYSYDEKGNLINSKDKAKENSEFKYSNGNELIKQTNPKGGSYVYEYDTQYRNRLTKAINNSKVEYSFEYDEYGNVASSKISNNDEISQEIESGKIYKIKNKNSGLYVGVKDGSNDYNANIEQTDTAQEWQFIKLDNGFYSILKGDANEPMVLTSEWKYTSIGELGYAEYLNVVLYRDDAYVWNSTYHAPKQQWEVVPTGDGTYYLKPKSENGIYTMGIVGDSTNIGADIQGYEINGNDNQKFYIEKEHNTVSNIESKAEYSQDGRFLSKLIDARGKETTYKYNFDNQIKTGTLRSITDAKGSTTEYTYDNSDRLTEVSLTDGNKTYRNEYQYDNDRLTKITHNGFNINFIYDNWGNKKSVSVGNQNLITNNYASNNRSIRQYCLWK